MMIGSMTSASTKFQAAGEQQLGQFGNMAPLQITISYPQQAFEYMPNPSLTWPVCRTVLTSRMQPRPCGAELMV
jgi:hypothetical protein